MIPGRQRDVGKGGYLDNEADLDLGEPSEDW